MKRLYILLIHVVLMGLFSINISQAQTFSNEFLDLNDNQVPPGWVLETVLNGGITNGRIECYPNDAWGILSKTATMPQGVSEVKLEFDGNINYSYWGMYKIFRIYTSDGDTVSFYDRMSDIHYGMVNNAHIIFNNDDFYDENLPLEYTDYRYIITLQDNLFKYKTIKISDQTILFDTTFNLSPGSFNISKITTIQFISRIKTDNMSWIDNLQVTVSSDITAGWSHVRNDLAGSSYYPFSPAVQSNEVNDVWEFNSFNYDSRDILTGNVTGDSKLEIVTVQDNFLYILNSAGDIILSQDISISNQVCSYVTMLEDVNGDQLLDIGVAYGLFPSYGQGKARIYDGNGTILKEFTKAVNSDMKLEPITLIGDDIIILEDAGYAKDPRGFSRWSISTTDEIWQYDVGPGARGYSIADINNDGLLEFAYSNGTVHNGASGNGTTDGDNYTIIINENGDELLTQIYTEGDANGNLYDMLLKFDENSSYKIVSFKSHGETYYQGTSRLHIRNINGVVEHTFTGLSNAGWIYGWADIDNDNIREIVATNKNNSSNILYIFDEQLNVQQSLNMPGNDCYFRAIANVNGDGNDEIIVSSSSDQKVVAYNSSLNEVWSWTGQSLGDIQKLIVSDNNQDGKLDVCVLAENKIVMLTGNGAAAISENSQALITIYPNPVSHTLNILNANPGNSIQIFGINGKKVFEGNVRQKIDVSALTSGIYFIRVFDNNKVINTYKFIKR